MDEPDLTLRLPANSTLSSIQIVGRPISCGAAVGAHLSIEAAAQALNAPQKSASVILVEPVAP